MNCKIASCDNKAKFHCKWGNGHFNAENLNLCAEHALELINELEPLLQSNRAWYKFVNLEEKHDV